MPGYPGWFPITFSTPIPVVNGTTYWLAPQSTGGSTAGAGAATPDTYYPDGAVGAADNPYAGSDIGPQAAYAVTVGSASHSFGSTDISAGPILAFGGAQPVTADATLSIDRGQLYVTEVFSDIDFSVAVYTDVAGVPTVLLGESDPLTVTFDVPSSFFGAVRIGVAFDDVTFEPNPTWTYLTDTDNLVASYSLRRGRSFETDKTDTLTGTITINDKDGVLDPTNIAGPYYTKIEPLLQIQVELWNPVDSTYYVRARGFIEEYNYGVAPSTHLDQTLNTVGVTRLEIGIVGIFAPLTAIEMQPDGTFGDTGGPDGFIFFDNANVDDRINQVLGNAGIDPAFTIVFSGNIAMPESSYSPSQNVMEVIQDCADAEFPTVSNIYEDRLGRAIFHGRFAKFDPFGTAAGASPGAWDLCGGHGVPWKVGDGQAVQASISDTAQIRRFSYNRGLAKILNQALCTPQGIIDTDIAGQITTDPTSIGKFGIRSWSAENLKVESGTTTGNTALQETKMYAQFIVDNYSQARQRITELTFMSMDPADPRAAANWEFISKVDVSDVLAVTLTNPGGGGFIAEEGFVEGITEEAKPLAGAYAMVTISLDVSPKSYFPLGYFS